MTDKLDPAVQPADEVPDLVPKDQYKKLQAQLSKAQSREREAILSRMDLDETKEEVRNLADLVTHLAKLQTGDADDSELTQLSARRERLHTGQTARKEISLILADNSADWSDPRLEDARERFKNGDFSGAVSAAKSALSATAPADLDSAIEAGVTKALRNMGKIVDKGLSQGSGVPDPAQLSALKADRTAAREYRKALLDAARQGTLTRTR